jgi:hypothetical protein
MSVMTAPNHALLRLRHELGSIDATQVLSLRGQRRLIARTAVAAQLQRKLIMRALATTLANSRHSTSGGILGDTESNEWMELVRVFSDLNPQMSVAEQLQHCRHRLRCPHVQNTAHIRPPHA